MNVVAIGAHPDDIEIGAGGTVALHTMQGDRVTFIILSGGGAIAEEEERKSEAREAASVLGVDDVHLLDFPDTRIPYGVETVQRIEEIINEVEPDRLYIHSEEDTHQDHRNSSLSAVAATRNFDKVFAYESPSTRSSFAPQHFVTFGQEILQKKIDSIRTHESQNKKKYLEADAMKGLARFRGRQANAKYAESFEVVRAVERPTEHTDSLIAEAAEPFTDINLR